MSSSDRFSLVEVPLAVEISGNRRVGGNTVMVYSGYAFPRVRRRARDLVEICWQRQRTDTLAFGVFERRISSDTSLFEIVRLDGVQASWLLKPC